MKNGRKRTIAFYKVFFVAVILILTTYSVIGGSEDKKDANQLTVTYSFEQPYVNKIQINEDVYDEVTLKGVTSFGNPGEPYLPIKGAYILLSQGATVKDITISPSKKICLGKNYMVKPVGNLIPISEPNLASPPVPDEKIYSSDNQFPGELYTEIGVYSFRGYDILVLDLYPVQYIPSTGEISYYNEMTVSIDLIKDDTINPLFRGYDKDKFEVIKKVDNPSTVETYVHPDIQPLESYDLLIITTDDLKDGFNALKNVHNTQGISTIIQTLSDIGGTTPEDIRDYIRDVYTNWGVDYVLLGGDDPIVPAKMLWVLGMDEDVTPYTTYMPSDLYYGCLDGTYNYDGDNKWGEPTDGEGGGDVDLYAEVYVGRACVDNAADVDNFVSKTVAYITEDSEEYLSQVVLAGEYLGDYGASTWGGNHLDQMIDGSTDDGYTTVGIPSDEYDITILYDREWPGNDWPKSELMGIINNNVHIVNHDGHANYGYNLKMDINDVYDLTNDKFSFIYSHGCMSGGFDNPEGYDCIAEHFTVKTENAAFAVIMNARYGWFWSYTTDGDSQRFNREFWDAIYGEEITQLGKANQDSKEDNLHIIGRSCIRWTYYQLNLFGDPTLDFLYEPLPHPDIVITEVTGGFGVGAKIQNVGDADATGVEWTIEVTGGMFDLINKTFSGTIQELTVDEEVSVDSKIFLGLGKIKITIAAECNEGSFTEGTMEGKQVFFITKIT